MGKGPLPLSALSDDDDVAVVEAVAGPVAGPVAAAVPHPEPCARGSALVRVAKPNGNGVGGSAPRHVLPRSGRNGRTAVSVPTSSPGAGGLVPESESDEEVAGGQEESRMQVRQILFNGLLTVCTCGMKRESRGQQPGAQRPQALRMHCTAILRKSHLEECVDHRLAFMQMHKIDQDHMLFSLLQKDYSRPSPADGDGAPRQPRRAYVICGERVCVQTCMKVWGIGSGRLNKIRGAVSRGDPGPPQDLRYLKKVFERDSPKLACITSFLREVYESEAETLPEELVDDSDADGSDAPAPWLDIELAGGGGGGAPSHLETRHLPPGSVFEYWRMYQQTHPEARSCFRYFRQVWMRDWGHLLKFRGRQQHSVCSTCVCHKLLLQQLSHDVVRRAKQMQAFEQHKQAQYEDRRVYWHIRAQARLQPDLFLSLIIDGMDQAKFSYPRHPHHKAKDLDPMQRPRLHVNGCIMHGLGVLVMVSRADFPKTTNVTCEITAHMLSRARACGIDLRRVKLHLQLDNTSSSNKNVILLRFLAYLVATGVVREAEADFLRKGHTHEDIDQFFGRVASWLAHQPLLETPDDFACSCQCFLNALRGQPWPAQDRRRAMLITQMRDWKTWLEHAPQVKNHTGPSAPHVFRFQRRSDAVDVLRRTGLLDPVFDGSAPHKHDVVLFCKRWMASPEYSQQPLVIFPWSAAAAADRSGGPPIDQERRPLTPAYVNHLRKFLPILRGQPYCLNRAAAHLDDWSAGVLPHTPLLDVSACLPQLSMRRELPCDPGPNLRACCEANGGGLNLDPACAAVELVDGGADPRDDLPCRRAEIVYGVAVPLHVQHGVSWEAALAAGGDCFKNLVTTAPKRRRLTFRGAGAQPLDALDVQPR